jgi:predicted Zn-dependent protease
MNRILTRWMVVAVLGAVVAGLTGCTTVPVTGRKSLSLISAEQEMALGLSSFQEMKKSAPISKDPKLNELVTRVGRQIANVASNDMPNAQWEFVVFDSKEANAFCLPGGKVGVYSGILPITKDDAGLATVIGHEVAHAVARHGGERISEAMLMQTGGQVLGATLSSVDPAWQQAAMLAYGVGTKVGRELPHSRAQESEADRIGLIYMARAGYDPRAAVGFWQRFSEYNKGQGADSVPAFLRTHPLDAIRIKDLQRWMPEAEAEFHRSKLQ